MSITLPEIMGKLVDICSRGFILSHRKGPTGIGKTLEDLLGIEENNIAAPDLDRIELKSRRENTNSLTTLFTLDRGAWQLKQKDAILGFGASDDNNDRINLYSTVSVAESTQGLELKLTPYSVEIWHRSEVCLAKWELEALADKFNEKIRHVLLVTANTDNRPDGEYFWFYRAALLMGYMTPDLMRRIFECNCLKIDLRLHLRSDNSVRNHGTAFRVSENDWTCLFRYNDEFDLQKPEEFTFDAYRGFFC